MKKLLFGISALLSLASCSGNGASEKAREDSTRIADSIAQVEAAKAAVEQARLDSIRQDSIAKAEVAAQYDDLVNQLVSAVNNIDNAHKKGNYSNMHSLVNKYNSIHNQINKVKKDLSSEQLSKVKGAEKKYKRLVNGSIAA